LTLTIAIYFLFGETLRMTLPKGSYALQRLDTMPGVVEKTDFLDDYPGRAAISLSPFYGTDTALSIRAAVAQ
jgi:hypothetical protein